MSDEVIVDPNAQNGPVALGAEQKTGDIALPQAQYDKHQADVAATRAAKAEVCNYLLAFIESDKIPKNSVTAAGLRSALGSAWGWLNNVIIPD